MKSPTPFTRSASALAALLLLGSALPAAAQSNDDILRELRALRERVNDLEKKLAAQPAAPQPGQWGMTPEQAREMNRIAVKTEALQDNFIDQGFKGLKITGQIDPTWIFNKNLDNASFVLLNNGGARYTYDNSYFGMAVIDFEKETDSGTKYKLTIAPERGTGALTNNGSIIHEATVSIPLGDLQTRLWVGQIPDWTGYEITLPAGNKLITHNLLFDTMAPTNYTGAVLDLKRGKWWTRIGLANMNTARTPVGEKAPVLIYRVDYAKGEFLGWGFTGLHGKAANFADDAGYPDPNNPGGVLPFSNPDRYTRILGLEVDGYFVRGDLSLMGQVSYGRQTGAAINNADGVLRDSEWLGVSGLLGYKFTPRFEGVLRADWVRNKKNGGGLLGYSFDDGINGIGRGLVDDGAGGFMFAKGENIGANRWALALGANYLYDENTIFKVEYRLDGADQPVFMQMKGDALKGYRKTNQLFGTSVVVKF